MTRWLLIWITTLTVAIPASQANPKVPIKPPTASELLPLLTGSTDALAGAIRGYLVRSLPNPLYEDWPNWGKTANIPSGLKWNGKLHLRPEITHSPRNHGKWRHVRVWADRPADNLVFDIRELQHTESGRVSFVVYLACDARVEYEQQTWQNGVRILSTGARARFRMRATLWCEAAYRIELGKMLLPDAIFRLRVVRSDVGYDNYVMEHVGGVGGELAEVLGDMLRNGLRRFNPSLERNLLAKANAAIEKSADTKEVRVSLYDLLKKKGWIGSEATPATAPAAPPEPSPTPPEPPLAPAPETPWVPATPENEGPPPQ